jgi:hypothetical protein
MLSIVLYGRNDTHGYNLHKRAALGLNCLAEVLSDPDDEILFVDYNTPDDHPTFPEAIADTLTPSAAARLRVLRVRPAMHVRFATRTHLQVVEPVARNVAVRRSNPRNRWILSTNPDMIFVPRTRRSLSEIAASLPRGFYHLPRFELPETLWEGFDRRDPRAAIEQTRTLGQRLWLNEIVKGPDFVKYDAPGDFQLLARDDLFGIDGFDEEMLLGWHVDSNIARRLHLLHGGTGDVLEHLYGYHCGHTRQITPAHRHRSQANSYDRFVKNVRESALPAQRDSWGLAGEEIEEVTLASSTHHDYVRGLCTALKDDAQPPAEASYTVETFDRVTYDARHVLPYLADLLAPAPRHWTAAWIGGRGDMFQLFSEVWREFGFKGRVLVPEWASHLLPQAITGRITPASVADIGETADVVIVDFGVPSHSLGATASDRADGRRDRAVDALVRRDFSDLVVTERARLARQASPRRFICINAVHNAHERAVLEAIAAPATPFSGRLRHGFVTQGPGQYADAVSVPAGSQESPPNLIGTMQLGESGERSAGGVVAPFGRRGVVLHGPHTFLPAGAYRADIRVEPRSVWSLAGMLRPVIVDVAAGAERLVQHRLHFFLRGTLRVPFTVSNEIGGRQPIYLRIFRGRFIDFVITDIRMTRLAASEQVEWTVALGPVGDLSDRSGAVST